MYYYKLDFVSNRQENYVTAIAAAESKCEFVSGGMVVESFAETNYYELLPFQIARD